MWKPASIIWPTKDNQQSMARQIEQREPLVQKKWGFVDGVNLPVMEPTNSALQNAMYNGWLHSVFVTGVLCFSTDGCIVWARHNAPGSWNDGDNIAGLKEKLLDPELSLMDHGIVADSACHISSVR